MDNTVLNVSYTIIWIHINVLQELPSYEDLGRLQYTEAVLHETLRMYPPLPGFVARTSSADYTVGDFTLPKGTVVEIPVWNIHHNPEYYPEPNVFKPERSVLSHQLEYPLPRFINVVTLNLKSCVIYFMKWIWCNHSVRQKQHIFVDILKYTYF